MAKDKATEIVVGGFDQCAEWANNTNQQLESEVTNGLVTLGENIAQTGADLLTAFTGDDLVELGNAAGNAATAYLRQKIQNIKDGLKNKTAVEIGSLVGEITPYVQDPASAVSEMATKIDDLTRYILGVDGNGTLAEAVGSDFTQFLSQDEGVQDALANLGGVKVYAGILNTISDAVSSAEKVMRIVEPIIPLMEISYELVLAWQNPPAGEDAINKSTEEVLKLKQELLTLFLGALRKYIYSIKIEVPNLILGAINTISVRDAVLSGDWSNGWLKALFDEDFYDTTMYSYTWEDSWNKTIRDTLGSIKDTTENWAEFNFTDLDGNPITRGEFMKSKFMTTFTQNFMKQAVATARKNAYVRSYQDIQWVKPKKSGSKTKASGTNNSEILVNLVDSVMESNLLEMSPFNSTSSIRVLSKQILDKY